DVREGVDGEEVGAAQMFVTSRNAGVEARGVDGELHGRMGQVLRIPAQVAAGAPETPLDVHKPQEFDLELHGRVRRIDAVRPWFGVGDARQRREYDACDKRDAKHGLAPRGKAETPPSCRGKGQGSVRRSSGFRQDAWPRSDGAEPIR